MGSLGLLFLLFIPFIGLITSTKTFTIWSGNSSCHLFSVLSFISYSLVKMRSFNTGFSFTCVCWPQCVHFVLVHFLKHSVIKNVPVLLLLKSQTDLCQRRGK